MNALIHLWPALSTNEQSFAILDTPMFPARFYFGPVGDNPDEWIALRPDTHRYHRTIGAAITAAEARGLDTADVTYRAITQATPNPVALDLLRVAQRLAALRADAGFAQAVSYLPELGALVDQAECVIAGKPFDPKSYAGGGGAPERELDADSERDGSQDWRPPV